MKRVGTVASRALLGVCAAAYLGCAPPGGPAAGPTDPRAAVSCTTGSGPLPRPLLLPGAEPNGVFDADLARDPGAGRLWMAYSGVTGPAGSGLVSTHLASSDDDGRTWCDQGIVNAATAVPEADQPARIAGPEGHWSHEVPALAHDPGAPAERRWTLVWHRYLHVADDDPATDDRHFEHGWIATRSAATPEALLAAPERKLFSSLAYHALPEVEAFNEAIAGGTPERRWDLDPDLGSCLAFSEPALLAGEDALYAALFCFRSPQRQEIVLVGLSHETGAWTYRGTLLTTADAASLDPALVGFNAPDLYAVGASTRLISSPTSGAAYLGCVEHEIDLAAGALLARGARLSPSPLIEKNPDADVFQTGACSYQEGLVTGIIAGETHFSGVQFRLVATGRVP